MHAVIAGMLLGGALAADAWAGPKREAVMQLLNAFEDPVRQADLAALGDGVDAELMEIASDPAVPVTRRGRAVSALAFYKTDAVRAVLERHLAAGDALVRRKAALGLAAFGAPAIPALAAALGDADLQLRIAAAAALGTVGGDDAQQALRARLERETEPLARDAIDRALGAGAGAGAGGVR